MSSVFSSEGEDDIEEEEESEDSELKVSEIQIEAAAKAAEEVEKEEPTPIPTPIEAAAEAEEVEEPTPTPIESAAEAAAEAEEPAIATDTTDTTTLLLERLSTTLGTQLDTRFKQLEVRFDEIEKGLRTRHFAALESGIEAAVAATSNATLSLHSQLYDELSETMRHTMKTHATIAAEASSTALAFRLNKVHEAITQIANSTHRLGLGNRVGDSARMRMAPNAHATTMPTMPITPLGTTFKSTDPKRGTPLLYSVPPPADV